MFLLQWNVEIMNYNCQNQENILFRPFFWTQMDVTYNDLVVFHLYDKWSMRSRYHCIINGQWDRIIVVWYMINELEVSLNYINQTMRGIIFIKDKCARNIIVCWLTTYLQVSLCATWRLTLKYYCVLTGDWPWGNIVSLLATDLEVSLCTNCWLTLRYNGIVDDEWVRDI